METNVSLESLFKEKLFRIPDYQRGYAWTEPQLENFWEDLVNLAEGRSHYTGLLTLKKIDSLRIKRDSNEFWLVEEHGYKLYHVVDGQQRLTTFVIFLQSLIEFLRGLPHNVGKTDDLINISESLTLTDITNKYLFMVKPSGGKFRTYKFGYEADNPSYEYLRHKIFGEPGGGTIEETFYTLNLREAKEFFIQQLEGLYKMEEENGIRRLYKKLTQRFIVNEYKIDSEFDVFVAFETMNNRGKKLSDLELLKNRLIYLTTLYSDEELDDSGRNTLRIKINDAWKEVYHQLGRNEEHPLNDDDFLKAHWIMYFMYSRERGNDYIKFLLNEQFTQQRIHKQYAITGSMKNVSEQRADFDILDAEEEDAAEEQASAKPTDRNTNILPSEEIDAYVDSLKDCAVHWFNAWYPEKADGMDTGEKMALGRLNRIGMGYFRPLVMAVLKTEPDLKKRIEIFTRMERFIFICFRLSQAKSNYKSSVFYIAAREFAQGQLSADDLLGKISEREAFAFNEDSSFNTEYFKPYISKKFKEGRKDGFYGWSAVRYFLYEYELKKMAERGSILKVSWEDLKTGDGDKISIEHIFPQTPDAHWKRVFNDIPERGYHLFQGSLGNLLILSQSINSALQNDHFDKKKTPKYDRNNKKIRNGYSDGSHSEIEVASRYTEWNPESIKKRGLELMAFMERRWNIKFASEAEKLALLHLE